MQITTPAATQLTQAPLAHKQKVNVKKKRSNTDVSVEAMRCIAAFMVVAIHVMMSNTAGGEIQPFRVFMACFVGDAVGIFWMIAGFFMLSEKKTYGQVIKRGIFSIALPTLALFLAMLFLYDWISGTSPLLDSITSRSFADIGLFVKSIVMWSAGTVAATGIAWYMFIYMLILVAWPVLNAFVLRYIKDNNRGQIVFMVITFAFFSLNLLSRNEMLEFSHHAIGGAIPGAIMVIWGYILYQHRDIFRKRKLYGILAIVAFFAVNIVRTFPQVSAFATEGFPSYGMPVMWYTPYSLLAASCVVIGCLSLVPNEPKGTPAKIITIVGGATLSIYLVHSAVRDFVISRFGNFVEGAFYGDGGYSVLNNGVIASQVVTDALYMLAITALIFILSLAVAFVLKAIAGLAKMFWRWMKMKMMPMKKIEEF